MLCRQDESTMRAGKQSKDMFSKDASTAYMPHLSLLYSDIDEHIRQVCMQLSSTHADSCKTCIRQCSRIHAHALTLCYAFIPGISGKSCQSEMLELRSRWLFHAESKLLRWLSNVWMTQIDLSLMALMSKASISMRQILRTSCVKVGSVYKSYLSPADMSQRMHLSCQSLFVGALLTYR